MNWNDMDEIPYRASQVCRVLGNPKTYQILKILIGEGPFTPTDLAKKLDRSIATICRHLKSLREVQLVRYQRSGNKALYKAKYDKTGSVLERIEKLVVETRKKD